MLYEFTIITSRPADIEQTNALYEFDFEDVGVGELYGTGRIGISVEAETISDAICKGLTALENVGLTPIALEDEDTVTASQIAERTGRTRQSIGLLANGTRGPGSFPRPWNSDPALYSWTEVARWFSDALGEPSLPHDGDAAIIAASSHLLRANALAGTTELGPILERVFA